MFDNLEWIDEFQFVWALSSRHKTKFQIKITQSLIIDKNCFNKLWRFNEYDFKWIFNQFDKQTKTSSNRYYYVEKHDQIKYFCFKCLDEFCWDAQQKYNQNTHTAYTYIHNIYDREKEQKINICQITLNIILSCIHYTHQYYCIFYIVRREQRATIYLL